MTKRVDGLTLPTFWDGVAAISFDGPEALRTSAVRLMRDQPSQVRALRLIARVVSEGTKTIVRDVEAAAKR